MKNRPAVLAVCIFLPLCAAFGQNQKILPLSSEIYDEMDALYLLGGLGTPSTARPWTVNEARTILERINYLSLNQLEQGLYDFIAAKIADPFRFSLDDAFGFDARLDAALEAYTHTNTEDFVLNEDWNYGYEKRQPMVKISLEAGLYSWLYIFTDLEYNRNRFIIRDQNRNAGDMTQNIGAETSLSDYAYPWRSWAYSSPFITNFMAGTDEFDFDWPKRANITVGGAHWNLSLARDRLQWGRGTTGNFIVDGHRDYDEYIRFSAWSDRFKYEWLNVFYPVPETVGENSFKLLMAHRLEFRFLPSLVFAVSENIMCRADGFNPRYINPAFIFHNWYDRDNINSLAHLELDYTPFKGYRFYTQAAIDQIQASWEDDNEPAAWGILAGIEHIRPAGSGLLSLSLEGAYTTPLLYRRDRVDFISLNTSEVAYAGRNLSFDYSGFPYGGDALILQADAKYRFPGTALLYARLFGMIHGKVNFFVSHNKDGLSTGPANLKDKTPSGDANEREYTFSASLGGNYTIPQPLSWLELRVWTELDYIYKKNKLMLSETGEDRFYHKEGGAADFQFIAGIGVRF
ncbi:MAG: capsule assembly Wzi family protein [Spirochaetaceae bacterium]|jgi:hypothetical protein|nr:capsule assembly Wzi family protein [Spirochaetaceae bacterium]